MGAHMTKRYSQEDVERGWPNQQESKAAGCKCHWWGGGSIIVFDRDCPVLDRHKMPDGPVNWAHEVFQADV